METYTQTVDEILAETDIVNHCPLPLDVIPNMMGINLCSVESVSWSRQDDGQLTNLTINFTPSQGDLSEDRPKEVWGVPSGTKTSDQEQLGKYEEAMAHKQSILDLIPNLVPFDLGVDKLISLMDRDDVTISYVLLDNKATKTIILSKDAFRGNKTKLFLKLVSMENAYVHVIVKEDGEHKELMTYEIDANSYLLMFRTKLGLSFPRGAWLPEEEVAEEV